MPENTPGPQDPQQQRSEQSQTPESQHPQSQKPQPPGAPGKPGQGGAASPDAAPAKKKRRRFLALKIIGALVVLLVLLVLLAPTILSTSPARSLVVGQINNSLDGRLEIGDWNFGWTGPIELENVRLFDAEGRTILTLARLHAPLSLIDAARGRYDLGEVRIENLDLVDLTVYSDGTTNLHRVARMESQADQPKAPQADEVPQPLPQVSGKITITNLSGAIHAEGQPTLQLRPSNITVDIPDIAGRIQADVNLLVALGNSEPGSIRLTGYVDAVDDNRQVNIDRLEADQTLALEKLDLMALRPLLQVAGLTLGGIGNGQIAIKVDGLENLSAAGQLNVDDLMMGGDALNGDELKFEYMRVPIKLATRAVDAQTTQMQIQTLRVETPQGHVAVQADTSLQSLMALAEALPSGRPTDLGQGQVQVEADLQVGTLLGQLRNTVRLEDVSELSGHFVHKTTIDWSAQRAPVNSVTQLSGVAGVRDGRPVRLDDIHLEVGGVLDEGLLQDLRLALKSGFFAINGGGQSLGNLSIRGDIDLDRLEAQARQFVDLRALVGGETEPKLAGTAQFTVTSRGDVTDAAAPIDVSAELTLNDVVLAGVLDAPLQQPRLSMQVGGTVRRSAGGVEGVDNARLTLVSGEANNPLIDLLATGTASLNPADFSVRQAQFLLERLNVRDLARVQRELAGLVPEQWLVRAGELTVQAGGTYDGQTIALDPQRPLAVRLRGVTVDMAVAESQAGDVAAAGAESGNRQVSLLAREDIDIDLAGEVNLAEGIAARLTALKLVTSSDLINVQKADEQPLVLRVSDAGMSGDGRVAFNGDVVRVNELVGRLRDQPLVAGSSQNDIRSGRFDGQVAFSHQEQGDGAAQTRVQTGVTLSGLTIGQALTDKTIELSASAQSADLFATIRDAVLEVRSDFVAASVRGERLVLRVVEAGQSRPASVWEMVPQASVDIRMPNIPALQKTIEAFVPLQEAPPAPQAARTGEGDAADAAPAEPLPPLAFISGSGRVRMNISRDGNVVRVAVPEVVINQPAFERGPEARFNTDQMKFALSAEIDASDDGTGRPILEQIRQVRITALEGNVGSDERAVAILSMPRPITLEDLAGNVQAAGSIRVMGNVERAVRLVEALQAQRPGTLPYRGQQYELAQDIATRQGVITLAGGLQAANVQVLGVDEAGKGRVVISEEKLELRNDLDVNLDAQVATVRQLSVNTASTQALNVALKGQISDWSNQRRLEDVTLTLAADWAKLWPMVEPLLSDEQRQQVAGMMLAGRFERTFNLRGAWPAGLEFNEAIRHLYADGAIGFDAVNIPAQGIVVQNLVVPFTLRDGVLETIDAQRPAGENLAAVAMFNGGQLNLGHLKIDLTQPDPRLTKVDRQPLQMLKAVTLNPIFANSVLADFLNNPLFSDPSQARGLMTVTLLDATNVPLSGATMEPGSGGRLELRYSIQELAIGNKVVTDVIRWARPQALNSDNFTGSVEDGYVLIENGVVTHQTPLVVEGLRVPLNGQVKLASGQLGEMTINIPLDWVNLGRGQEQLRQFLPEAIPIPLSGNIKSPQFRADLVMPKLMEEAQKKLLSPENIGRIFQPREQPQPPQQPATQPAGQPGQQPGQQPPPSQPPQEQRDPVQDLLDIFGRPRDQRDQRQR